MTEQESPKCPHCGSDDGYYVSDRANGWLQYLGTWEGDEERPSGEDGLRYTRSRTVTCQRCGRRSPRPSNAERHPGPTESKPHG